MNVVQNVEVNYLNIKEKTNSKLRNIRLFK
jgi:hypothetical protein